VCYGFPIQHVEPALFPLHQEVSIKDYQLLQVPVGPDPSLVSNKLDHHQICQKYCGGVAE